MKYCSLLLLLIIAGSINTVLAAKGRKREKLPPALVKAVINDDFDTTKFNKGSRNLFLRGLVVRKVELNDDNIPDYLLYNRDPINCGTAGCGLQIFVSANKEYKQVSPEDANSVSVNIDMFDNKVVKILPDKTNGLHDIRCVENGTVSNRGKFAILLKFDGQKYIRANEK